MEPYFPGVFMVLDGNAQMWGGFEHFDGQTLGHENNLIVQNIASTNTLWDVSSFSRPNTMQKYEF